ncbi:MAG: potassium-transporting ATPase subunit C [Desulfovibrionales bacterium GWA2_65_9]|nr:MAG: potassium-transporting ATPase subunit C [Desulfovibrionales bacterium GWA2_65_9]
MLKDMLTILGRQLRPAFSMLIVLSLLTGLIYPSAITLAAKVLFPHQAEGSLITDKGTVIGSELIGQQFTDHGLFWGRPSATSPQPYNASASGGSNLAPAGKAQLKAVAERVAALRASDQMGDPGNAAPIPADLVTASGSGLDPHISPEAALWQVSRVAHARSLDEAKLRALVARHTEARQLGILGEPRVNVLRLNRALDSLAASAENTPARP